MTNKKYDLIVVDPPWPIKKLMRRTRPKQISIDYKTLPVEVIANLGIQSIASDECWLFLWATQKYLWDAKTVLLNWGFKYLVTGVWEKTYGRSIRHSQKPDKFYELIYPLGTNRIDIFARKQREGWDVWGNEVESDVSLEL